MGSPSFGRKILLVCALLVFIAAIYFFENRNAISTETPPTLAASSVPNSKESSISSAPQVVSTSKENTHHQEKTYSDDTKDNHPVPSRLPPSVKLHEQTQASRENLQIHSIQAAKEFLDQVTLPKFNPKTIPLEPLTAKAATAVKGRFMGKIEFDDPRQASWDLRLDLEASLHENGPEGRYEVVVSKDGIELGRSSGDGALTEHFRSLVSAQGGILVEILRGEGYLQLYPFQSLDVLMGVLYLKKNQEFHRAGITTLRK